MSTYLDNVAGRRTQKTAINASSGAGDANKIIRTNAQGVVDPTLLPATDVAIFPASENLAGGDFVNIWDDAGTTKVRKADASSVGKEADGFVLAPVTSPANATVYFEGKNTALTSLVVGRYYLSTTPGGVTATAPSGSGNVVQYVGKAINATTIAFEAEDGDILA